VAFIDVSRGIFLIWMITAHALWLAKIPQSNALFYLRPPGWATTCFIMLSGLSIAIVFLDPNRSFKKVRNRLLSRAVEIGSIAYISNLIFRTVQIEIEGTLFFSTVVDILTFQYPWSISAILIPVFIVLLLAPFLIKISHGLSPWVLFACGTLIALSYTVIERITPAAIQETLWFQICFLNPNPLNFFPLYRFSSLGIWCFALGVLLHEGILKQESWKIITPVCFLFLLSCNFIPNFKACLPSSIIFANHFLISIGFAMLIANLQNLIFLKKLLSLIGRSSLLVFIIHRPLLQAQNFLLMDKDSPETLFGILLIITICTCVMICWMKEHYPDLGKKLKMIGF